MDKRTNLITGIVLAAFALWYLYEAFKVRVFAAMGKAIVDSTTMPKIWAVCLLLLSLCLIVRSLRTKESKKAKASRLSLGELVKKNTEVIWTFIALLLYIACLHFLGFILSSMLYIFAQTIILMPKAERSYVKAGIMAVVCSVAAYMIFVHLLAVLLPVGTLFESFF